MKTFRQSIFIAAAMLMAVSAPGCKRAKASDHPATVSTVAKEKHTKSKAHKRDKKEEKAMDAKKQPEPANPN